MTTRGKTALPHLGIKWTVRPPQRPTWPVGTPLPVPVITTVGRPGRGTARARGRVPGASPITARSASMEAMTASASGSTLAPAKPGAPDSAGPDRRRPPVRPRVVICADLVVEIR